MERQGRFSTTAPVRFKDIDLGGHAHHSHALVFFEEGRAAYWRDVVGRLTLDDVDYILAEATVRFHERIFYPDSLKVEVWVSLLGKKHFVMQYEVFSDGGNKVVSGSTTQVMFNYETRASKAIPDDVRARIEQQDGPFNGRFSARNEQGT